ncbi:MAG: serine/threonine protein kinase [Ignavibacteriae bacterium]|nr:serine/threonine protein kinase [Ignavibacteriota bacterium]
MKNNWEKINELFAKALELDEKNRIEFLKQNCGNDKQLFDEIISLLNEDEKIHPLLDKKASELINVEEKLNFIGQQIGNYKLIKEIASGGMGTVFLAERCDGIFEQKVALKIIKPGLSTIPIIRRFQHERQILANLQHPNIARLFDGGVTDDRRPFFTMEFVDGIPIDEYCDQQKLTIALRLKLFIKVCETVQYAHNNLVIHRDLKPNNILIQNDGTIKLLDFGISKVLSAEVDNHDLPTITQAEINLLTPEYSSPEQIKNSKVSVSTDVYSLGLILFKLLSGKSAHEFNSRTFNEFEKVICDQTIPKPSTVITNSNNEVFDNRKIHFVKLKKLLNGDLDNICQMALRKEPERRYASVEMLSYDIERYLNNLPILARKESFSYLAKKFIIRHKKAVIANFALFIIINGLIFYYTIQLKEQRDKANWEARKAEQVASFLQELFLVADPDESKGRTITARELLDRGASKLMVELEEDPEIKSQLLNTIGNVYTNLGLLNSAEKIFLEIKNKKNLSAIDKQTYVETLTNLGRTYGLNGKYDLAGEILLVAKDEAEKSLSAKHHLLGELYNSLGTHYYQIAKFDSSTKYYKKAEQNFVSNYGNENEQLSTILYNLGVLEFDKGNLEISDSLYRKSLEMHVKIKGELNAQTATIQNELASVLRHSGKYKEAEELYKKALNTRIKIFGNNHADIAHTLNHLSRLYYNQEQFEKAEHLARQSLEIRENLYDETHPEVSASRSSLAGTLMGLNKFQEAEKLYRLAYNASKKKFGNSHPYTPALLGNIGNSLMEQQKFDEAEKAIKESISILEKLSSYRPAFRSGRIVSLADLYNRTKRYKEAEELLRNEIKILDENKIKDGWLTGTIESQLGFSLHKQSNDIEAEGLLINGYNHIKKSKVENSLQTKKALNKIIEFYTSKKRKDKVEEYIKQLHK